MRVLYVHNVGKIGGAERVTLDIIAGLDPATDQALLVTPEDGTFPDQARALGASTHVLDIRQPDLRHPLASFAGHRQWLRFLAEQRIDLIHTGDLFVTRTLIRAANRYRIPLVCHVHFPVQESALAWIFRTQPATCHFVYCSKDLHDHVRPRTLAILPRGEHHVIHNGVDTERFKPRSEGHHLLSEAFLNIGIIANLQERKGHEDLIEAISILRPDHPDIRLHILGGDLFGESREPALRERVSNLGLEDVVVFHGQVDNVRDYLNELDLVVCASHEEAFPISILEAMACGKAIVSTDVNGIPEAIVDGESGVLVSPRMPSELARGIAQLIRDTALRERLGMAARARVEQNFALDVFREKIGALYGCMADQALPGKGN